MLNTERAWSADAPLVTNSQHMAVVRPSDPRSSDLARVRARYCRVWIKAATSDAHGAGRRRPDTSLPTARAKRAHAPVSKRRRGPETRQGCTCGWRYSSCCLMSGGVTEVRAVDSVRVSGSAWANAADGEPKRAGLLLPGARAPAPGQAHTERRGGRGGRRLVRGCGAHVDGKRPSADSSIIDGARAWAAQPRTLGAPAHVKVSADTARLSAEATYLGALAWRAPGRRACGLVGYGVERRLWLEGSLGRVEYELRQPE
jgi:hypothetical protein